MTTTLKRLGLATAAAAVAMSLAGGAYAAGQDSSPAPGPGGRPGRFGGPGGPMGRGGPGGPGGMLQMMEFRRLDLTDEQKARVKAIVDSHRDEYKAIGTRAMAAHMALDEAISGSTFDEATVRIKAADVAAVDADAAVARARGFNEVYQILTPDQQAKLKEIQTNMKQRMANRGGRGGGPGAR